jgi:SAM-dependent methyltransferase
MFWAFVGPNIRKNAGPNILSLLDGRTDSGRVVEQPTGPGVGGVVIEIGPGSGLWVDVFSDRHLYEDDSASASSSSSEGAGAGQSTTLRERRHVDDNTEKKEKRTNTARSKVTHVYGVEPNASHHVALRRSIEAAGLQDVYEIVPVGIEDLGNKANKKWEGSVEPGSVDCIFSLLCLCSIPDPERHIRELYELLRPGGRWYVYEHVRCEYSWYMRLYQRKF